MNREHWLLLAAFIGLAGVQIGTLEHGWRDVLSTKFVAATLLQVAIVLRGFFTDKPNA